MFPELAGDAGIVPKLKKEFSSADDVMSLEQTTAMLEEHELLVEQTPGYAEILR